MNNNNNNNYIIKYHSNTKFKSQLAKRYCRAIVEDHNILSARINNSLVDNRKS